MTKLLSFALSLLSSRPKCIMKILRIYIKKVSLKQNRQKKLSRIFFLKIMWNVYKYFLWKSEQKNYVRGLHPTKPPFRGWASEQFLIFFSSIFLFLTANADSVKLVPLFLMLIRLRELCFRAINNKILIHFQKLNFLSV